MPNTAAVAGLLPSPEITGVACADKHVDCGARQPDGQKDQRSSRQTAGAEPSAYPRARHAANTTNPTPRTRRCARASFQVVWSPRRLNLPNGRELKPKTRGQPGWSSALEGPLRLRPTFLR